MQIHEKAFGRRQGPTVGHCVRGFATAIAAGFALAIAAPAVAVEMEDLYTVEVPVDPFDTNAQNEAYRSALTEVLVRITGSTAVVESERMAELFPNPVRYVSQYRPGADRTMVISLEGTAIENVLRQAQVPIWGSERPLTLVWIAIDWGLGDREIVASGDQQLLPGEVGLIDRNQLLRDSMQEIAAYRGIPLVFPLLDTEDLESIGFSDIWGGFDYLVLEASERYGAESVLVGRIRPGSDLPPRWTWHHEGERQAWNGAAEQVTHQLADLLAARHAMTGREPVETIRLTISGVRSVSAFGRVQQLMDELRGVQQVVIDTVDGSRITYSVTLQGGTERLRRALEQSGLLVPVEPLDGSAEPLDPRSGGSIEFLYQSD